MKKIKTILSIFIILILSTTSCKKEKRNNEKSTTDVYKEKVLNKFNIKIKLITDKKDRFQLNFKNIDNDSQLYKINVDKINEIVEIESTYEFKYDFEYPTVVYLGLGYLYEKNVEIKEVEISYKEKTKLFYPKDFKEYFYVSKYVDYDNNLEGKMKAKRVGKEFVPIFYLKREAIDMIKN